MWYSRHNFYKPSDSRDQAYTYICMNENMFETISMNVGWTLDNAVRIRDKMQVVYKEMTLDGVKSNKAKWNLIGGIQFKGVKKCHMFK